MYHSESLKLFNAITKQLPLSGGISLTIGSINILSTGKDGIGGLIEEWFGIWAKANQFIIIDPKLVGGSQEFPDYYVGTDNGLLEVKAFDLDASANFDIANFESYCQSVSNFPARADSDYIIFGYRMNAGVLTIEKVWLKKIWEITCPSKRWPLKTQTKRGVIYNIRPAKWYSSRSTYHVFKTKDEFINALFDTQQAYKGQNFKALYQKNSSNP